MSFVKSANKNILFKSKKPSIFSTTQCEKIDLNKSTGSDNEVDLSPGKLKKALHETRSAMVDQLDLKTHEIERNMKDLSVSSNIDLDIISNLKKRRL